MIAKAIARGTPCCTKGSIQCSTVKGICLDADNGADDIRAMLDDCSVLADWVDKLHCAAVEAAKASEGRNVKLQQDLNDEFYGEPEELIGGKAGGNGCAIVSAIVERTAFFELCIVQGVVAAIRRPVYISREIEIIRFHCRAALRPSSKNFILARDVN